MGQSNTIGWRREETPPALHAALDALGVHYPITADTRQRSAIPTRFVHRPEYQGLRLVRDRGGIELTYDQPIHALRGIGAVLSGLVPRGKAYEEHLPMRTLGIMLDCSRNAVMTVTHFQGWLRQLALLGYNMAMLYTEDTYELPREPYFGYLRGRYTQEELRQIDEYAAALGIEMIGCIQTLGHMEQILRWRDYYTRVQDTRSVLLVDEPATYQLIDKMVAHFAGTYRSRRIHIGMDESDDLGHGKFLERFGYQRNCDIFNRHVTKVVEICTRHGLKPMIWSDMYFRMGSTRGKTWSKPWDPQGGIPPEIAAAIPPELDFVFWDYDHDQEAFYRGNITRQRALGKEPLVGSGVWTWGLTPWCNFKQTWQNAAPCVNACRKLKVQELFFTLWGDQGAYCEFDSALAGLARMADMAYTGSTAIKPLIQRFAAVCGSDYQKVVMAGDLLFEGWQIILWDDPLLQINWKARNQTHPGQWSRAMRHYRRLVKRLASSADVTEPIDLAHAYNVACYFADKLELLALLDRAYRRRNRPDLAKVVAKIRQVMKDVDRLLVSFRRQWFRRNKPFGFEVIQIRLAGKRQRYQELAARLRQFIAGEIERIEELEQTAGGETKGHWRDLASGSVIV
ncbi:MAG: family 20 glycosylhydrolase [Phycisphaerae bacterium]|nr:family 20 glycosylhydrolase [Phycisphaerae bacterium]